MAAELASDGEKVAVPKAALDVLRSRLETIASQLVSRDGSGNGEEHFRGRDRQPSDSLTTLEAELDRRERRVSELEGALRTAMKDRELATALAGRSLVPGAATQLMKLWREELQVVEDETGCKVATVDGRSVSQAVSDWLSSQEYSHFCLPTSIGGSGSRDSVRPTERQAGTSTPKNLGEAVVMRWREESASRTNNLLKPIGLRRHR